MLGFTSDSPHVLANPHQLDFAPYASKSYSAQWNVPELLHDMHMLRSNRILGEMEVDEPWLGLWLPWEQVSIGHQNGGEFYRLFCCKTHFFVGVLVRVKGGV